MTTQENALMWAQDQVRQGKLTTAEANVEIIRMTAVRVVTGRLPKQVRQWLMEAVKDGRLGRLPKSGLKPEVFFNPNAKHRAIDERNKIFQQAINAIGKVCTN
mgnify:CR=1 FL=1